MFARILLFSLLAISITVPIIGMATDFEKYMTKYDNIDVDKILNNDRILTSYIKCLMEEGPCTSEGRELKKTLPDALATDCAKCSEKQREVSERVILHVRQNRAKEWRKLVKKFDPEGSYQKRHSLPVVTSSEELQELNTQENEK